MNKTRITFYILSFTTIFLVVSCVLLNNYFNKKTDMILEKKEILWEESRKNFPIEKLTEDLNFSYDTNEFLNNLYIKKDEMVLFVSSIESFALTLGVESEIVSIIEEVIKDETGPQKISLKVRSRGKLENIIKHLLAMQNGPFYTETTSYTLNVDMSDDEKYISEINFNVLIK